MLQFGRMFRIEFDKLPLTAEALTDALSGVQRALETLERRAKSTHFVVSSIRLVDFVIGPATWRQITSPGVEPFIEKTWFVIYGNGVKYHIRVERQVCGKDNRSGAWRTYIDDAIC